LDWSAVRRLESFESLLQVGEEIVIVEVNHVAGVDFDAHWRANVVEITNIWCFALLLL